MRSHRLALGAIAAWCCATACTIDRPQPDLKGQDVRLTIIHTADIHSRLFPYNFVPNKFDQDYGLLPADGPYGGMARITTMVKRIRASAARSIWLDSGDAFEGAPVFNEFKGEAEMRSLSLAGLEGAVLGNHEFDLGSQNLFEKIDNWAQYPLLVANYAFDDPPDPGARSLRDVVRPYQIYDVQGIKIGVIGLGNQDTLLSSYEGGNSLGFRPIDNATALGQWVTFLRPQVDLIVVVSHLGLDNDEGLSPSEVDDPNEALPLEGVDLILGGHLHIVTNPPKSLPHEDTCAAPDGTPEICDYCKHSNCNTLLIHSGAFAKYVGRIDLVVHVGDNSDKNTRSRIVSYAYDNIPIDSAIPDDPAVASLLWPYSVKINQDIDLNGVFAYTAPNTSPTAKITRADPSGGDSQLGNLVARSMQVQQGVEAEFALTNSLGVRADFERGPLTNEQMFNVFPFENTIVVMYLSGTEVQDMLDFVAQKSALRGCQTQAQVAGITFDMVCRDNPALPDHCVGIDPATGVQAAACAKNIYLGENCRNGNSDGPVDPTKCAKLEPTGLYRVAVNDYIAAGGSGFAVLKRNSSQQNTGVSLRDGLTVYLNGQTKCPADKIDETDPMTPCSATQPCLTGQTCTLGMCTQRTVDVRWGSIACLDETNEPHDGRIRPVFE